MKMRKWLSALLCASMVLAMPVSVNAEEATQNESIATEAVQEENNVDAQNVEETDQQEDETSGEESTSEDETSGEESTSEDETSEEESTSEDETSEEESESEDEKNVTEDTIQEDEAASDNADQIENSEKEEESKDVKVEEETNKEEKKENDSEEQNKHKLKSKAAQATVKASGNWETENNNSQTRADVISPNQSVNGNLSSRSDVDWYKVTLNSNCYISLTLNHPYIDSGATYWQVKFYNSSGDVTYQMDVSGNTTSKRSCRLGLPRGTYYIEVSDYSYSAENYNLRVNYVVASYWETENNNSIGTADSIAPNTSVTGSLMNSSDADYYKFTLGSNGYISLTLNHSYIDSSLNYWRVRLFRGSDGSLMNEFYYQGNISSQRTCRIGLPKGTYYVQVSDYFHSDIDYNLRVNYVATSYWETEDNDSIAKADSISPNVSVTGSLASSDDNDYYKFNTGSNGYISLTLNHTYLDSGVNYWRIRLYRGSDSSLIEEFYYQGNISSQKTCRIGLPKGTYYLQVSDYYHSDVDYNLRVNYVADKSYETEVNNSTGTADSITKNVVSRGTLMTSDDEDFYTFSLASKCYVNFRLTHGYINDGNDMFILTVSNRNNSPVMEYALTGRETGTNKGMVLPAGKYYVKIHSGGWTHSTTPYGILVQPILN